MFTIVTLAALVLLYLGTGRDKRLLIVSALWATAIGLLARTGFFEAVYATPPHMLLAVLPPVILLIWYSIKIPAGRIQPGWLLVVHTLRLPVELILYQLYLQKKVPVIMTFKGWNFDILVGLSAILLLLVGITRRKRRSAAIVFRAWNIAGLVFLAIIASIAVLSAPLPLQQLAFDQPNVALLSFPYTWLPAVVVPAVLLAHLLCLKKSTVT